MSRPILATSLLVFLPAGGLPAGEPGLVGYWNFDEGKGIVARDRSGKGNDGVLHDAKWVKNKAGYCLEFDGQTSWVDCGSGPSVNLHKSLTLEAWVFPTGQPRGEPGILGKQFESYLLTYYTDGNAWFYIGAGGNSAHAPLAAGDWSLLTATFDGKTQHFYVNGKLIASHASTFDRPGGRLSPLFRSPSIGNPWRV
jgi:hypothetical protein